MRLLIATQNRGKLREIGELFAGLPVRVELSADAPPVVEDGATLAANAVKKAVTLALATGSWTLADDTGLDVTALGGAPGVHSARYAGPGADPVANMVKLLRELEGAEDRRARFRCVIALCSPSGLAQTVEGFCDGRITSERRGTGGFGYDPVFLPDGETQTFAEMAAADKNRISHRAQALRRAIEAWSAVFRAEAPRDWPPVRRRH